MRSIALVLFAFISVRAHSQWLNEPSAAFSKAKTEHKYVLLNFSGSDWCGPCVRMKEDIFNSTRFSQVTEGSVVLLNADFPRQKKNKLTAQQQRWNNEMADKYDPDGIFPCTLLLDENGNVLQKWDGFPKSGADQFLTDVQQIIKKHP